MNPDSKDYAPYLQNGWLFLPSKTVDLLRKAGLSPEVLRAAKRGMAVTESPRNLTDIRSAMSTVLLRVNPDRS